MRTKHWPWLGVVGLLLALVAAPASAADWVTPDFQDWAPLDAAALEMSRYAGAPEAPAVVLFDRGHVLIFETARLGEEHSLVTARYRRIKVFQQAGVDLGDVRLACRLNQVIRNVEGRTVLPDGRDVPLHAEDVHEAVSGRYRTVTFALPAASPGCILEYRYEIHADLASEKAAFLRVDPWVFPNSVPTLVSSLHFTMPTDFAYEARFLNAGGLDTKPQRAEVLAPESPSGRALRYTWEFRDLAAFEPEPHMGPAAQCLLTGLFRLTALGSVRLPEKWNDLADYALQSCEAYYRTGGVTQKWLRRWVAEDLPAKQRAKTLFEFARDSLRAAEPAPQWRLREPWVILKERSATPAERNLLLTHLLRQSGIDARAVLIASHDQPRFSADWLTLAQFDQVLAQLKLDGVLVVLDANCRACPFGLLPAEDRVATGLVPGWEAEFLSLAEGYPPNTEKFETQVTLNLPDDVVHLRSTWTLEGLAAVDARREIHALGAERFASRRLAAGSHEVDLALLACTVEDDSSYARPLRVTVEARVPGALTVKDVDRVTFKLPWLGPHVSEGFEATERIYPVELDYTVTVMEELTVALPPGASVDYLPPDAFVPGRDVTFAQQGQVRPDEVHIARQFALRRSSFTRAEYAALRDVLLKADPRQAEPLILRLSDGQ